MTTAVIGGLALAVAASVALNASYLTQHAGSRSVPSLDVRRPLAALRSLFSSRVWLIGGAVGLAGWALHVAALSRAPLSLVQAFAAGGLVLTVPAAARFLRERLRPSERAAVIAMAVALVALAVGAGAAPGRPSTPLLFALCAGAGLLAAGLAGRGVARARGPLLGAAAGVLYGAADAATKALTLAAAHGIGAAFTSGWPIAVALLSLGAFACFQRGLQQGPAVPVIALMTVATTVAAVLCGLVAFGDPLGTTPALAALHALAFVAIAAGGWVLAGGQARRAGAAAAASAPPRTASRTSPDPILGGAGA